MISRTLIKVRSYHLDAYGHVNNSRYLEFLEEGRWALVDNTIDLAEIQRLGLGFVVVNININYRRPAGLDTVLEIRSSVSRVKEKSAVIHQEVGIEGGEAVFADADVTFVMIDMKTGAAVPLIESVRNALRPYENAGA